MPPKVIAKNSDRTSGVLPVNAAVRANAVKGASSRLKLEVRRLPPGLTLTEFEETLGDEWKLGNGKVDWREYRQGKVRPAGSGKVPEQSRCYIHVLNELLVRDFEKRFLEVIFQDKAGTYKNPDLKGLPPTLGFAPNQRTPLQQAKQRNDNRQGTIDQDSEFIAFLESETQPIVKASALDTAGLDKDGEKKEIKTTPLIEDLREKKANKAKAAQAKAEKAEKDKKVQATKASGKDAPTTTEKDAAKPAPQHKVEQIAKDAAKALNKQAAAKQQQNVQSQQATSASPGKGKKGPPHSKSPNPPPSPGVPPTGPNNAPTRPQQRVPPSQRPRGSAEGIKKMLQKDLGIKPKAAPTASSEATTASTALSAGATHTQPSISSASSAPLATPPTPRSNASEPKASPVKAYLKHANPSQGMTEILIQQALSQYGDVTNVTIDPRKGTAIAVFKQTDGLKKALEAKRVTVADGAVEVLEFRDRPSGGPIGRGGFRGGRGGRGGARGAAAGNAGPATVNASAGASAAPT